MKNSNKIVHRSIPINILDHTDKIEADDGNLITMKLCQSKYLALGI